MSAGARDAGEAGALDPRARRARRLGILGGSFDPPHRAHLQVARAARQAFSLDHVVFVPAARPPHKPERVLAAGQERARMLALLLDDEPAVSVWGVELARPGRSYTIDTVNELRREVGPDVELFLILGSDNLPGLPGWRAAEELLAMVQPIVVPRPGFPVEASELEALSAAARARLVVGVLDCEPVDLSSSALRARLARGEDPGDAVPERLREYVLARGIYAAR